MRQDGCLIITTAQGATERATRQCAHCGNHFVVVPGSGTVRGFCQLCNRVTCGAARCMAHFPFEKKLDLVEAGKLALAEL